MPVVPPVWVVVADGVTEPEGLRLASRWTTSPVATEVIKTVSMANMMASLGRCFRFLGRVISVRTVAGEGNSEGIRASAV
jgi:hypothetical protein